MHRAPFLFALLLVLWGGRLPMAAASAPAPQKLRIATYNLENYTAADRMTPEGYRKDYPKPEKAKRALHQVIADLDADLLALQEMGTRPYLEEFRKDLKARGLDYPHSALVEAGDENRHIALLSRRPLKSVVSHTQIQFKYFDKQELVKRGVLEAVVETALGDLTLWVVHLKSRFTERPDDPSSAIKRGAEATAIRDMILRRHIDPAKALFVILGDFNDGKTKRPLRAMQVRGKTEIATLLPAADSRGERWSHFYLKEESYERVDHILVSAPLLARIQEKQYGLDSPGAAILDTPSVFEASDHRPVYLTLDLKGRAK